MTGDVDQPELKPVGFPVGKTQVDRNAAGLLFRQPVRIDTGKSPDESGLAVIDVPGGADQDCLTDVTGSTESVRVGSLADMAWASQNEKTCGVGPSILEMEKTGRKSRAGEVDESRPETSPGTRN
ncbi:MAG: hypothetical protein CM1200mP2_10650 [Planctomycetaceae bacterium]|nr:MAG: hypothetical protein CM1200mP2_10650 [Planctomycetaceae bacterium]